MKAACMGGNVTKADTFATRASRFDHAEESCSKKKLSERIAKLSKGDKVQRDVDSAFLLMQFNTTNDGYGAAALNEDSPQFYKLYETTTKSTCRKMHCIYPQVQESKSRSKGLT